MSRKDNIHDAVKLALEKEGWFIQADPYIIKSAGSTFRIDLKVERFVIASRNNDKIAVEIKSFSRLNLIHEFYGAFGQYMFYRDAFSDENLEIDLYLAVSNQAWKRINQKPFLLKRIQQYQLKFIVVDTQRKTILTWKN